MGSLTAPRSRDKHMARQQEPASQHGNKHRPEGSCQQFRLHVEHGRHCKGMGTERQEGACSRPHVRHGQLCSFAALGLDCAGGSIAGWRQATLKM